MQSLYRCLCCVATLAAPAGGRALTVDPGAPPLSAGAFSSLALVDGRPAIAYTTGVDVRVNFVRATDPDGEKWGAPVTVDAGPRVGDRVSLLEVNGHPAVCYYDFAGRSIKFVRAADPAGSVWGPPVAVVPGNWDTPPFTSVEIVDGNPAICFTGPSGNDLAWVRAADANGLTWETAQTVDQGPFANASLKIVDGRPAIAYSGSGGLWFLRASDRTGSAWGTRVKVAPLQPAPVAQFFSLETVNSRPAISFYNNFTNDLTYVRAADVAGAAWNVPVILDSQGSVGPYCSLAVVNGKPCIGYHTLFPLFDLKYVEALDSDGDTAAAWGAPVTVDSLDNVGTGITLREVNGRPALSYHSFTAGSLNYLRATDTATGTRWPPGLSLSQGSAMVRNNDTRSFGSVPVGSRVPLVFTVRNPNSGSADLAVSSVSITGPDAAEFSVTGHPFPVLPPLGTATLTVQYAPVTRGRKSAVLSLFSNAEGSFNPYNVTFTADSVPEIVLERPAGSPLADGAEISAPGNADDMVFTLRNPGGATLDDLSLTFTGPAAGQFSIVDPPSPVAPGGATTFAVRRTPVPGSTGNTNAMLHIASNVEGSKNPFDLVLLIRPGTRDQTFRPVSEQINSLALQADGKILAAGFSSLERYHPDGSFDNTFFAPSFGGFPLPLKCVAVQKDGRILVGGFFREVSGRERNGLVRLHADGSVDESFVPGTGGVVYCIAIQPDRKILVSRETGAIGSHEFLLRLHADGSIDTDFSSAPDRTVRCIDLQSDGKILIGGFFQTVDGKPVRYIARLHPNGTLDTFAGGYHAAVECLAVQPDGRILAGGLDLGGILRLLPGGPSDPSWELPYANGFYNFALQTDGQCLITGSFTVMGFPGPILRPGFARINPDGSVDRSFDPKVKLPGGTPEIRYAALQADGRILFGGTFGEVDGVAQPHLARLENDPAFTQLKTEGRSTVRWLRSGSAPEVRDVTFDLKPDNSPDWTRLGTAARISGGWELPDQTLPPSGHIRAQAYAGGSVIESIAPILTALQAWRLQYFSTTENTGTATDDADPDHDGLTNFTEFAFGLSPVDRASNALPEFKYANGTFSATFTAPEGREDILYGAEWSATMHPGTWSVIPDTGAGSTHKFTLPALAGRAFVRFVVKR